MATNADGTVGLEGPIAVGVGAAEGSDARRAVQTAMGSALDALGQEPALVVLACGTGLDLREVVRAAAGLRGNAQLVGGSVTGPLIAEASVIAGERGRMVGALALRGLGVAAGVGASELGNHPRRAGESAAQNALECAGAEERSPRAVLVFMPPGAEEAVLQGVVSVVGRGVPLWGCTVADEDLSGRWAVFADGECLTHSVAVAVIHGEFLAGSGLGSGYWPTTLSAPAGRVGGRMVRTLGGKQAAEVYAEWLGADLGDLSGSRWRQAAAAQPWGIEDARAQRLLVKAPGTWAADGSVGLFADIREGDTVHLLTSTPESLVAATGTAAGLAMGRASLAPELVRGVLLAQGAGRALALRERVRDLPAQLRRTTGSAPVLGLSGYGEQCSLPDGRPAHLNLSVSALVLGG